jgi:hypothetical protein
MGFNLRKALLTLSILCLAFVLIGIVVADDQSGQGETYGAYPGAPTSAMPSGMVKAYPSQPVTVSPGPVVQKTVVQLGQGSTSAVTAIYSTQAPPAVQQKVLMSYNVQTAPPKAVYFSGTYMPWTSFYQVFPANAPALWVSSSAGWSWYATCPIGGWVQDLMYVPYTGTMKLYEFYPDGTVKLYSYGFATPGYKYIWFYADTPGRHITLFTIYDKPSNYITIDVA